jgi:hypothetical protein
MARVAHDCHYGASRVLPIFSREFLRNEKFDAKNFFDRPDAPRAKFKRNQYGFSTGGPIVRNQTFFFGERECRTQSD